MMMRDDVSGVIPLSVRVTAQHSHTLSKQQPDHSKTPPPHHFSSRFGSLTIQDTYVQSLQGDLSRTNPDWCTSVLDPTVEHGFQSLTSLLTAQLTEAQGTPQSPCVKDRHTFLQALEAFFHVFATRSRQHLHGNSLVYLKFSTPWFRCILPTSSTLRKRLPSTRELSIFFFENWTRQRLISVSHLFVLFARIPLGGAVADVTRQDLLLPPTRTFPSLPINLPTSRSSMSFTMSLYCHSLTQTDISKETPCSTFIFPWENHSATKFIKRRATLITDRLLLSLSRPLLFWSIHSTPFVSPYSIFLRCPCPDSSS